MGNRTILIEMDQNKTETDFLKKVLKPYGGEVRWDEPMAPYTSLKVGGSADAMVFPESFEEVLVLMEQISCHEVPYFVLGNGSNLLVKAGGYRGIVLHLKHLNKIDLIGIDDIMAEGGAAYPKLATYAMENHLGGLEFAIGIPGSVGGAIAMNAGVPGHETSNALLNITIVDETGKLRDILPREVDFGYRRASLPSGVIVSAAFRLTPTPTEEVEKKMKVFLEKRRERQPLAFSNCGSVFKNPPNGFAGDWVEKAGLKGFRIGGAEVYEKHGNFIINKGLATANDVLALIDKMREEVSGRFGVSLELEVKVIGTDESR